MGSGAETAQETVDYLIAERARASASCRCACSGRSRRVICSSAAPPVRAIAVLDRTKEPGAPGEPLYQDVVDGLRRSDGRRAPLEMPRIVGGRYGLASKEFTPAMVKGVFDELGSTAPKNHFTIGINDDVSQHQPGFRPRRSITEAAGVVGCLFYGLGADGTVGANKNSIKIIGEQTPGHAQGYFVYDSKKSGSRTMSHLRFGPQPIRSTVPDRSGRSFIACHQFQFLEPLDVLDDGGRRRRVPAQQPLRRRLRSGISCPATVQQQIIDKHLRLYVIDADRVALEAGMRGRINTIMQTCFFAISGVLPRDEAIAAHQDRDRDDLWQRKGEEVVERTSPRSTALSSICMRSRCRPRQRAHEMPSAARARARAEFVRRVTAMMIAGRGNELPVSALPVGWHLSVGDGPMGEAEHRRQRPCLEARALHPVRKLRHGVPACRDSRARLRPPVAGRRARRFRVGSAWRAAGFPTCATRFRSRSRTAPGASSASRHAPCKSPGAGGRAAPSAWPRRRRSASRNAESRVLRHASRKPPAHLDAELVKASQFLTPLFEFSGACAGCGETPYLEAPHPALRRPRARRQCHRLLVDLWRQSAHDPLVGQQAEGAGRRGQTRCSRTTPSSGSGSGCLSTSSATRPSACLQSLAPHLGPALVRDLLEARQISTAGRSTRSGIASPPSRRRWRRSTMPTARRPAHVAKHLVRKSVWIVGGDGWAYDIGYGGLDHVLASGRNVNILVLDTEVYSNTGGQASKSTPRGGVAKFAAGGKAGPQEGSRPDGDGLRQRLRRASRHGRLLTADDGRDARSRGATTDRRSSSPTATASRTASTCGSGCGQQKLAVASGHWPLYRFKPPAVGRNRQEFVLDSQAPSIPLKAYAYNENRYKMLAYTNPDEAARLLNLAQDDVDERWRLYSSLGDRWPAVARRGEGEAGRGHRLEPA